MQRSRSASPPAARRRMTSPSRTLTCVFEVLCRAAERTLTESCARSPLNRPGTADEAAKAVLFLASPLAAYISGVTLEATGGMGI